MGIHLEATNKKFLNNFIKITFFLFQNCSDTSEWGSSFPSRQSWVHYACSIFSSFTEYVLVLYCFLCFSFHVTPVDFLQILFKEQWSIRWTSSWLASAKPIYVAILSKMDKRIWDMHWCFLSDAPLIFKHVVPGSGKMTLLTSNITLMLKLEEQKRMIEFVIPFLGCVELWLYCSFRVLYLHIEFPNWTA